MVAVHHRATALNGRQMEESLKPTSRKREEANVSGERSPQRSPWQRLLPASPYIVYLSAISAAGILIVCWSIINTPLYSPLTHFVLLLALSAVAALTTTSVAISNNAGITYGIGPAVAMAAVPFFGPLAGVLINAATTICLWLIKPADRITWKKSWLQLAFNIGMHVIAIWIAGSVLLVLRNWLGPDTIWGQVLPWFPAAYIYEELNFWILAGVLRLQHGREVRPWAMWREDQWATQVGVMVLAFGSAMLAFAVQRYDAIGIIIFSLPVALSAYAFRLYVRQMQSHLDNLEQIVAERTRELAERTEELADTNRQKDVFLAVLTHDMITPLTSIQMYTELIQDDPSAVLDNPDLAQIMLRSQKTVLDLVKNILDLEKITSGGSLSIGRSTFDFAPLVPESIDIVRAEAIEKSIAIEHQMTDEPLLVHADRQQLQRVLLNLLSNAVKYTPAGGRVWIEVWKNGQSVIIYVKDTGYGIPSDELPFVFDRFRRVAKMQDKASGTGLGLAITKALVEEHDGEISVSSEVGQGSTFTVVLPLMDAAMIEREDELLKWDLAT